MMSAQSQITEYGGAVKSTLSIRGFAPYTIEQDWGAVVQTATA